MTTTLTKADLATKLAAAGQPLTASQIKKATIADLTAMVDAIHVDNVQMPAAPTMPKMKRAPKASAHAPKAEVKKVKAGTKREQLLRALVAGATAEQIDALCVTAEGKPWSKAAAAAARGVFWRSQMGMGTKVEGGKYYVVLPDGMKIEDCIVG